MDLLMPIIGCALGIVISIMSIKVVIDKGKKAIVGAAVQGVQKQLEKPEVQTALQVGAAVATGGASLGATAATTGIRMASNAGTAGATASATANATASAVGKGAIGKLGKTGNFMRGGAEATAGTAGMTAQVGKKIAKDLANSKLGRKISTPVKDLGSKVYTFGGKVKDKTKEVAGNAKNAIGNSRAIKGVKNIGSKAYTSGKNTLAKMKDLSETAALHGMVAKDNVKNWVKDKAETAAIYGLEAKSKIENSKIGQGTKKAIKGVKSGVETARIYGMLAKDYVDETVEFAKSTKGNKLRRTGVDRIKKALESNNVKTGNDLFLGRLFGKRGQMQEQQNAIMGEIEGEIDQIGLTGGTSSIKDRMLVKLSAAKGTARRLADRASETVNSIKDGENVAVAENTNGAIEAAIPMENMGAVAAIPMYGYNSEGNDEPFRLVYNDFSVLKSDKYDRSGALIGSQTASSPRELMSQYSGIGGATASAVNTNEISTSQHYDKAMQAINDHFQDKFGTQAFSQEEGRAMAQMLDRLQTQREITASNKIRSDVLSKQQPEQQKVDAIAAELGGNSAAANARQNYIETHTETIVSQQTSGGSISDEDMQKIREQAQKVVEEGFESRIKNEKGFRDEIFGQDSSTALESKFSEIDNEVEKKINDAIASNRESLNASYAMQHPEVAAGEIDSSRIMDDMRKDIEKIVDNQVSQRSKLQDNPEVVNVAKKEVVQGSSNVQQVDSSTGNARVSIISSSNTNPANTNPQIESTGQKFSGSRKLGNSTVRTNPAQIEENDNLQGSQSRSHNKVQ